MRRLASNIATALSLIFCAATVTLWVRSYWVADSVSWVKRAAAAPTAADRRYAQQNGYAATSVWVGDGVSLRLSRGVVTYCAWHSRDVLSVWDEIPWRQQMTREAGSSPWGWTRSAPEQRPPIFKPIGFGSQLGFGYKVQHDGTGAPRRYAGAPLWSIGAIFTIPPLAWLQRYWRRRGRRVRGRCTVCGYDLRASQGRCPECGAVPSAASGTRSP